MRVMPKNIEADEGLSEPDHSKPECEPTQGKSAGSQLSTVRRKPNAALASATAPPASAAAPPAKPTKPRVKHSLQYIPFGTQNNTFVHRIEHAAIN